MEFSFFLLKPPRSLEVNKSSVEEESFSVTIYYPVLKSLKTLYVSNSWTDEST